MELTARKKEILKIVVESYIDTAEPLGSKAIAERMPEKVSSATVRNELAELSDMGYLEQPHTSAGRIPSPLGYRLYVNELMERKPISAEEAARINDTLRQELTNPCARFFTALSGGVPVGYIGCLAAAGEGDITNVAVHPDFRRREIGRASCRERV